MTSFFWNDFCSNLLKEILIISGRACNQEIKVGQKGNQETWKDLILAMHEVDFHHANKPHREPCL